MEEILKAGINAPTGRNLQSPVMVAVTNPQMVKKISEINSSVWGSDGDPFYGAPAVIVVFADKTVNTHVEDGSLVIGNLLNAAASLGIGACWIHRARQSFETDAGKALMKEWGLGENYVGIGNCILGYPDKTPNEKIHKEDYVIYVK